jgi:hypothetical protein
MGSSKFVVRGERERERKRERKRKTKKKKGSSNQRDIRKERGFPAAARGR